jgi:2-oxoglutarate ferredoxin oxidoreductase subunit delta
MSRIVVNEERCKGCLLCTEACPVQIIVQSARFNAHGYKVVEVRPEDKAKCTGCTSCALVCPDLAITVYKTRKAKSAAKGGKHG